MSEIYTKTVVNHEIKGFFACFKEIFCYVLIKIIQNTNVYCTVLQPTQALTQFGKHGIDFINYKEFHITGNKNIPVFLFHFLYFNRKTSGFQLFYIKTARGKVRH